MKKTLIFLFVLILCLTGYAAPEKPYPDLDDGEALTSTWLIGTFNVLYDWADGNITNDNIASSAAIAGSKIVPGGIGTQQLEDGGVAEVDLSATYTASLTAYIDSHVASATTDASIVADGLAAHVASDTDPHTATLKQTNLTAYNLAATLSVDLAADGHKITGLADGVAGQDAATVAQVDVVYVPLAAHLASDTDPHTATLIQTNLTAHNLAATLSTNLVANNNKITVLATGTELTDAVNYGQLAAASGDTTTLSLAVATISTDLAAHVASDTDPHTATLIQTNLTVYNLAATLSTDLAANDNKVTGLATGTDLTDAVNYGQMSALGDGMPTGAIIMWSGSAVAVPSGWAVCDGTNGTPDLRDKFVVGAGTTYAVGATGGATAYTSGSYITVNADGSHSHTAAGTTGVPSATAPGGENPGNCGTSNHTHDLSCTTSSDGSHSHALSGDIPVLPPYHAIYYIMKL